MATFVVKIQRTIITEVSCEAKSAAHAREYVQSYGLLEATSDFPVVSEEMTEKLKSVKAKI